jgi:L-threonylcarbamoyladenylate synthase
MHGEVGLSFGNIDLGEMNLSKNGDLLEAASNLYSMLRILDKEGHAIAVAPIPNEGVGLAINDKLRWAKG